MAKNSSFSVSDYLDETVIYLSDGSKVSLREYKAMKRAEKKAAEAAEKKAAKKKRSVTAMRLLAMQVANINTSFKLSKSYMAYFRHGYKQWGNIWRTIVRDEHIQPHFEEFVEAHHKATDAAAKIEKIAKKSDKDIYGYIEKLAYAMDDMLTAINKIADGCVEAQLYANPMYKGKEVVYGSKDGKRLGIKQLNERIGENITATTKGIHALLKMASDGTDVMDYDPSKSITFVYA